MWSFNSLAETLQSATETAASRLREASDIAQEGAISLKKRIESEISVEYERTAAAAAAESGDASKTAPPPPPMSQPPASLAEKVAQQVVKTGVQLLSPLDDAGGTPAGPSEAGRIVMLPWEQPGLSEETRQRMRALSQERSIFLAPPARGHSSFRFDLHASLPLLMEALAVDKRLEEQRHLLVPQQVTEEQFFTNYFHHLAVLAANCEAGSGDAPGGGLSGGACGGLGGGGTQGGGQPHSPSSSSPVVVSAAASEASDVAYIRDQDIERAPDVSSDEPFPMGGAGGGGGQTTSLPPRATLLTTPEGRVGRGGKEGGGVPASVEEQFECVSNHLIVESAQRSRGNNAKASSSSSTTTPGIVAASKSASGSATKAATPVTPAQALTLDWEEELRAELS